MKVPEAHFGGPYPYEKLDYPEVFRKGVLDYLAAHAWGNATAADLWKALDAASGGGVSGPLATFVDQPGLPLVEVEFLGEGRVRLTQRRFGNAGVKLAPQTWAVPLLLRYGTGVLDRVIDSVAALPGLLLG